MPDDFEDLYDLDAMDDAELGELIRGQIEDSPGLEPDRIDIDVRDGFVTLGGRVGTEQEYDGIEMIVSDRLGIVNYANELVVDELVREERAEGADQAVAEDDEAEAQLGEAGEVTESTADHLIEDVEGDSYGTHDVHKAIERGQTYTPPDRPVQEGSTEEHH